MKKEEKQYDEDGLVIRINKEEVKREREKIRDLSQLLLKLPNHQYNKLPINQQLINALHEAKRLKDNPLKRQLSFITRLIDEQGYEDIHSAYLKTSHPYRSDSAKLQQVDLFKEKLLSNDSTILDLIINTFSDVDIQYLRQLVRNTKKEKQKQNEQNEQRILNALPPNLKQTKSEKLLTSYLATRSLN